MSRPAAPTKVVFDCMITEPKQFRQRFRFLKVISTVDFLNEIEKAREKRQ